MDVLTRHAQERVFAAAGINLPTESRADELRAFWREGGIKSLYFFTTGILKYGLVRAEPHKAMCDFIQGIEPPSKRRKVLLVPRDTYKSTIGSKGFPLWILVQPMWCGLPGLEHRILLISHAGDNAKKQVKAIRQQIERNELLSWLYPEIIPDIARTTWTDSNILFPRQGVYGEDTIETAGIDTHIVSRHYTVQIKDDLEDKASYESPTIRNKVKETYRSMESLFVNEREAYDLLIGTRWGVDDVYADIQKNESDAYEFMVRPLHWTREELEADLKDARDHKTEPIWNMDPELHAPEHGKTYFFFPEIFPQESCQRLRKKQGTFMYSMLYLNNPKNPDLCEFREKDLRFFMFDDENNLVLEHDDGTHEVVPFDVCKRVLFWDPALSEEKLKKNARNAMIVAFRDPKGRIFIVEAWAEHKKPTLLFSRFIGYHQRYQCQAAAIEDVGFQTILKFPLFQNMREVNYSFSITEQKPISDKHVRIRSFIPYVENHQVFVQRGAKTKDLLEELRGYPLFQWVDLLDGAAATLGMFGLASVQGQYKQRRANTAAHAIPARMQTRSTVTGY